MTQATTEKMLRHATPKELIYELECWGESYNKSEDLGALIDLLNDLTKRLTDRYEHARERDNPGDDCDPEKAGFRRDRKSVV